MKYVAAAVMGFLSGCLIYLASGLLPIAIQVTLLVVGWAASSYILLRGAQTVWKVVTRGFLLGAAEWLVVTAALVAHALYAVEFDLELARIRIIAALCMVFVCLACFAVIHFWRREIKPERSEQASLPM